MDTSKNSEPGWYPDPTGRHQRRYWTGIHWSRHVEDQGRRSFDDVEPPTEGAGRVNTRTSRASTDARSALRPPGERRNRRPGPAGLAGALGVVGILGGLVAGVILTRTDGSDGQGGATTSGDRLAGALTEYFIDLSAETVSPDDAACMSNRFIETVGRSTLVAAHVDGGADPLVALGQEHIQTGLPRAMECLDDATATALITQTLDPALLTGLHIDSADCLIDGWMEALGRDKLIELYAVLASRSGEDLTALVDDVRTNVALSVIRECQVASATTSSDASP